jgi:hypothetical protein
MNGCDAMDIAIWRNEIVEMLHGIVVTVGEREQSRGEHAAFREYGAIPIRTTVLVGKLPSCHRFWQVNTTCGRVVRSETAQSSLVRRRLIIF